MNKIPAILLLIIVLLASPSWAQEDTEALSKKLANPVASLISVPIEANYDKHIGPNEDGSTWTVKIQPVIPFSLSEDWNLISRTILPLIDQDDVPVRGMGESGIGDILQSFFFSPQKPTSSGWILGAGPILLLPTASDDVLGSEKWGAGPTAVALKQTGPWTCGILVNHIESFAGDDDRSYVSASYMQPFLNYITRTKTTIQLNTESTYDWNSDHWSVPINFGVYQLIKIGGIPLQLGGGVRYWADSADNGPEDWGFRLKLTFLFPK
jgi:hypothetical protein